MMPFRSAGLLFAPAIFFLLPGLLAAEDEKPEVTDVTVEQLGDTPPKYSGKLVRIEDVVESATEHPREDNKGTARYTLVLKGGDGLYIRCDGKPTVGNGDRVRVTGTFTSKENSFVRHRLTVELPHGKVEKVPANK